MNKHITQQVQAGQTLIETLAAIFILVMGVTAATGLAIYALSTSTNISKQIIGTGLAREGIEAVKNMRDTNWLKLTLSSTCYDYVTSANDANCYDLWLDKGGNWNNNKVDRGFRMDPGAGAGGATYTIAIDSDPANKAWILSQENTNFGLDFDNTGAAGFYIPSNSVYGSSIYSRTITLIKDNSTSPYRTNLEQLKVVSQVWWTDKKCPKAATYAASNPTCRIELQTYLTNWKNY